ncbi:hypothetical protein Kpol_1006p16 [Vanderwaltozyma polyspora DSM 70294]|uniref:Dilute domain-containing protein n=1 Tax=Vanderwaltozyma polyspora (strain ATCC 22028 / DSM 70294 / BCRC 21397 / CBS 2163 / NBRC 10782 / NRRL Y-8283 / UCD 57-17) TaxID=436907 RepID=A7TQ51_VANPO|nr:uncharacterized protein Kpol_1006p16 [Vanderwaltozyma polyspora DSM 70294]EDO15619.1 hypothetical protein Kpol_1006p16 [Vanderwaltozyma polyspora DSM 70294]
MTILNEEVHVKDVTNLKEPKPISEELNIETKVELVSLLKDINSIVDEIDKGIFKKFYVPDIEYCYKIEDNRELYSPAIIFCSLFNLLWSHGLNYESDVLLLGLSDKIHNYLVNITDGTIMEIGCYWLTNFHTVDRYMNERLELLLNVNNKSNDNNIDDESYKEELFIYTTRKRQCELICTDIYNIWTEKICVIISNLLHPPTFFIETMPDLNGNFDEYIPKMFESDVMRALDNVLVFFDQVFWRMKCLNLEDTVAEKTLKTLLNYFDKICFNGLVTSPGLFLENRSVSFNYNLNKFCQYIEKYELTEFEPFPYLYEIKRLLDLTKTELANATDCLQLAPKLTSIQIQSILCKNIFEDIKNPSLMKFLKKSTKRGPDEKPVIEELLISIDHKNVDYPFINNSLDTLNINEIFMPTLLKIPIIEKIMTLYKPSNKIKHCNIGSNELKLEKTSSNDSFKIEDFIEFKD